MKSLSVQALTMYRRASSLERRGRVSEAVGVTLKVSGLERVPGSSTIFDCCPVYSQRAAVRLNAFPFASFFLLILKSLLGIPTYLTVMIVVAKFLGEAHAPSSERKTLAPRLGHESLMWSFRPR